MQGVVPTSQALQQAQEAGLDLVEVNPTLRPPLAKILDFGQFQYKQQKLASVAKAKAKKTEVKGIRLSMKIGEHDLATRRKQSLKFLEEGHKVRLEIILRGRERAHGERARGLMEQFAATLGEDIFIEVPFSRQGGATSMQVGRRKLTGAKPEFHTLPAAAVAPTVPPESTNSF